MLYTLGVLLLLLLAIWLILQTTWGQQKALPLVTRQLSGLLGTEVTAGHIQVDFFEAATLYDAVVYDDQNDTLLAARSLHVDLSLFSLWDRTLAIEEIVIEGVDIRIKNRTTGTNYDHILQHLGSRSATGSDSSASSAWKIDLEDIILRDTEISMMGDTSELHASVGSVHADWNVFDPSFEKIALTSLSGSDIDVRRIEKIPPTGSPQKSEFPDLGIDIEVGALDLQSTAFSLQRMYAREVPDRLDPNHIDISDLTMSAQGIIISKDSISMSIDSMTAKEASGIHLKEASTTISISPTSAVIKDLKLIANDSRLEGSARSTFASVGDLLLDFAQAQTIATIDRAELHSRDLRKVINAETIQSINLNAFDKVTYNGTLSAVDGQYKMTKGTIKIGNKVSAAGTATIRLEPALRYDVDLASINTTQAALNSIFPLISFPTQLQDLGKIQGSMIASGDKTSADITRLDLRVSDHTVGNLSGKITGLTSIDQLHAELQIRELKTDPDLLFNKESNLPSELFNLGKLSFVGTFEGGLYDYDINGQLTSEIGSADIDMQAQFTDQHANATYSGRFDLESFDVGQLLQDTTYGVITAAGNINGSGLRVDDLDVRLDILSERIDYNGTSYKDIQVNGTYAKNTFNGKINSQDEKLKFNFDGTADLKGENTVINFTSRLDQMDLTQFGIGDSLYYIKGTITGNLRGDNIDNLIGAATIDGLIIGNQRGVYTSDTTVSFAASSIDRSQKRYQLKSGFVDATVKGNIKLSQLPQIIENYIQSYIPVQYGYDRVVVDDDLQGGAVEAFDIDIKTKDINPLLAVLVTDQLSVREANLRGTFASDRSTIDFKGQIDSLVYGEYLLESVSYFFDGRRDFINGNVIADKIFDGEDLLFLEAFSTLSLTSEVAGINLELYDSKGIQTIDVGGDISQTDEYIFSFRDSVKINESQWIFSPYNQISYSTDNGLYMQDVTLSKGDQSITIYTDENENGEAIELLTDNFQVSELTSIIRQDNETFGGVINGNAVVNNIWDRPFVTADVTIDSIMIDDYAVGRIAVSALQDAKTNTVQTQVNLSGKNNDAYITASYVIPTRALSGSIDISRLEVEALDPFLSDVLIDSRGAINGSFTLNGTPTRPLVEGTLNLEGVQTTPVFTNTRYAILDQSITITNEALQLGDMVIVDINNNVANVSGEIYHTYLSEIYLDITADSDQFLFLNTTPTENALFYGNVTLAAHINVRGPQDKITIDGSATAINNSKLSISPFSIEQIDYENDYIIYADPREISLDSLNAKALAPKGSLPFDVNLTLTVDEDSEFEMVMNPITGDNLVVTGDANLIFQLRTNGEIALYGTYTVTQGQYLFTYGLIAKEFQIQPGSRVIFNGDPLTGTLDVSAIYSTYTAVYDLLVLETGDNLDANQVTEAKRRRPVNVLLSMENTISAPEISLDIVMPQRDFSSISDILDNKLEQLRADPDELNNQVFGLMIFDSFILATNAETDLAQTGTNIAIKSISGLVSKQLNKLADGLIKGVELSIDVDSYSSDALADGSDGLITELGVGVSKTLFNDRLTVTAGTNIDLESSASQSAFNNLAGDFVIEYALTEDRRYRVKVFRKSNYDRILDENNSKNGVSFFVRNEFGTITRKKKKQK